MDTLAIAEALDRAEQSVEAGNGLSGTGFWSAVAAVKRNPALVDDHAERIAAIDRAAFEQWALLSLPIGVGTTLLLFGLALGIGLIGFAYFVEDFQAVIVFYVGLGALLTTTHGLGHLLVGRFVGIRFTHWFIGEISQPQPGVKVDYVSYLRTPPASRAWMHAAGAIATKLVPFALLGAAVAAGLPAWSIWGIVGLGVGMIITDVAWSTKSSDWKKFKREMKLVQS